MSKHVIKLSELRLLIKRVILEAQDTKTIAANTDPHERELAKNFPKWGNEQNVKLKLDSPAEVKAKQITALLTKSGVADNADYKKKITNDLLPFLKRLEPTEIFLATAADLAKRFSTRVLGIK